MPIVTEQVEELLQSRELADGCSSFKTKTRLATKSTVTRRLVSGEKVLGRLDESEKILEIPNIECFRVFRRVRGTFARKIHAVTPSNLSTEPARQVPQRS